MYEPEKNNISESLLLAMSHVDDVGEPKEVKITFAKDVFDKCKIDLKGLFEPIDENSFKLLNILIIAKEI